MGYQALARKWRPQSLNDVVGQDITVRILRHALQHNKLHHAYLLTGTRGVGKTSLGRILAKCFNCEKGITDQPCQICASCKSIEEGRCLDFYEIDAASRTKVEDTRELLENIHYPSVAARFKIYLIDEIHMLSQHSFNALLKTLEEPPTHVKFILATTEPHRLPITILSRCLQFHLKNITVSEIQNTLERIAKQEQFTLNATAANILAQTANGSLRDALSLTDQALAYSNYQEITEDVLKAMLGWIATQDILPLLRAFSEKNLNQALHIADHFSQRGMDFHDVVCALSKELHKIALLQQVPDYSQDIHDVHRLLAKQIKAEDIQLIYQITLLARRDLDLAPSPYLGFEMMLLRWFAFNPELNNSRKQTSGHMINPGSLNEKAATSNTTNADPLIKANTPAGVTSTTEENAAPSHLLWPNILSELSLSGMTKMLAENCALKSLHQDKIILYLAKSHAAMLSNQMKQDLQTHLKKYFNKDMRLMIEISDTSLITPQTEKKLEQQQIQQSLRKKYTDDQTVKQFIETYDATLEIIGENNI